MNGNVNMESFTVENPSYMLKVPVQKRSRETVASIIEACSRLLVSESYTEITTDKIAVVAGVSIGSLYQFFANKEAIVAAVIDDMLRKDTEFLKTNLAGLQEVDINTRFDHLVELGFTRFQENKELRIALQSLQGMLDFWGTRAIFYESYKTTIMDYIPELPGRDRNLVGLFIVTAYQNILTLMLSSNPTPQQELEVKKELKHLVRSYLK